MNQQEMDKEILHKRAVLLAKEEETNINQNKIKIIEFTLGEEHYGIEANHLSLVFKANNITNIPTTPTFIEGVINVHGRLTCVINLKAVFGLNKSVRTDSNRILIISEKDIHLGLLVDSIVNFEWVQLKNLQTSLPTLTGLREDFLIGITPKQQIILDAKKLMTHEKFIVNEFV